MPKFFDTSDKIFSLELAKIAVNSPADDAAISAAASKIINDVKSRGDTALDEYTRRFDNPEHRDGHLKISKDKINTAYKSCSPKSIKALELAAARVEEYHKKQKPQDIEYFDSTGTKLGWLWNPIDAVGIYVPGGTASYPSSVIMNAIPAKIAGVKRIAMVTPLSAGKISPLVLAAAKICGVNEIYTIGGAQAVAALAYGTETIAKVDKIVGPGNAYVAAAKRIVFGVVGIDTIAGPSEIFIIADEDNNPDWLAADLLSQAEHDKNARVFLCSTSKFLIDEVIKSAETYLTTLLRREIAGQSFANNSYFFKVKSVQDAVDIANILAPEHLELCVKSPENYIKSIKNAGAIFVGKHTPEAIGDYIAGPSHVLPTSGAAKFSSGLSVYDFMKKTSLIGCSAESFAKLATATELLAIEEGLSAHALSISIRKNAK